MVLYIVSAVVPVVVVFAIVAALQPAAFRVVRSTTIAAPASVVFDRVNEPRQWDYWSPWAKIDPACKIEFEGPAAGVGAVMKWSGNGKVGEGRMTVIDSRRHQSVRFRLDFLRPFKATNSAEFTFTSNGEQTAVTWSMTGEKNFPCKAMCLVVSMDKMCGKDFEKGLSRLKAVSEAPGDTSPAAAA